MASHTAMKSAMNIIAGNSDKKEMFDLALEAMADDVSNKVGEMERFMELSENFMDSIDLQNGIFEPEQPGVVHVRVVVFLRSRCAFALANTGGPVRIRSRSIRSHRVADARNQKRKRSTAHS